jgi:hypothetical protein
MCVANVGKTSSTDSGESISFHTEKSSDSTSGVDVNDDNYQLTDEIVDKHLDDLKKECLSYETRDVAKFMEKLKTQSESLDGGDGSQDEKRADVVALEKKSARRESESRKEMEMMAKQKDEGKGKREGSTSSVRSHRKSSSSSPTLRKPRTIDMDATSHLSPTRQPVDSSQVQIIKIKSPSGSRRASREASRNNSIERSPSRDAQQQQQQQTLKKPEGGILKKPSPKFGKASEYKLSNSLRPDSFISPFSSFESKSDKLSPSSEILPTICAKEAQKRASLSDYERDPNDYHHQAMKSRSLESSLEHLKSALKHQSSYEQQQQQQQPYCTSPMYDPHKYYNLSAQHSIESNRSPVRYCSPNPPQYYNEPFYEYPKSKARQRETRSLERPDFSRQSSSEYERERYYEEPPYPQMQQQQQAERARRHSVYEHRSIPYHYYSMSPDDYLVPAAPSSHYEQPSACVDCYYQSYRQPHAAHYYTQQQQQPQPPPLPKRNSSSSSQPPPQQQQQPPKSPSQSRQRQSRSRKKLSRRMSSNYFNKSFDDDDIMHSGPSKQPPLHDNEEIRV